MSSSQAKPRAAGQIAWAGATDRGSRPQNEDRFGAVRGPEGTVLVVCDGLGGHRAGEVAAAHAVKRIVAAADEPCGLKDLSALALSVSREIAELGRQRPECEGLGTTLVVLVLRDGTASFVAVGDSRLYRSRGGRLELLAEPHELGRILVREGVLTREEVPQSAVCGRVTSYLGQQEPEIAAGNVKLRAGDRFALVTDGVLEGGEGRLSEILSRATLDEAALGLVRGIRTQDNATALVATVNSTEGSCLAS